MRAKRWMAGGLVVLGLMVPAWVVAETTTAETTTAAEDGAASAEDLEASDAVETGPRQVIANKELMKLLFDPYYIDLRKALAEEPADGKAWRQAYIAAFRLAEVTNLLYCREGKDYMATDAWRESVDASRDATVQVGEAIKQLDYPLARERYAVLIKSCNACHAQFEPTRSIGVAE